MNGTEQQLVNAIREQINASWESASHWYVGISEDADAALKEHHVSEQDRWICCPGLPAAEAKQIAQFFLEKSWWWHTDGEMPAKTNGLPLQVFAFLKNKHTSPRL